MHENPVKAGSDMFYKSGSCYRAPEESGRQKITSDLNFTWTYAGHLCAHVC